MPFPIHIIRVTRDACFMLTFGPLCKGWYNNKPDHLLHAKVFDFIFFAGTCKQILHHMKVMESCFLSREMGGVLKGNLQDKIYSPNKQICCSGRYSFEKDGAIFA